MDWIHLCLPVCMSWWNRPVWRVYCCRNAVTPPLLLLLLPRESRSDCWSRGWSDSTSSARLTLVTEKLRGCAEASPAYNSQRDGGVQRGVYCSWPLMKCSVESRQHQNQTIHGTVYSRYSSLQLTLLVHVSIISSIDSLSSIVLVRTYTLCRIIFCILSLAYCFVVQSRLSVGYCNWLILYWLRCSAVEILVLRIAVTALLYNNIILETIVLCYIRCENTRNAYECICVSKLWGNVTKCSLRFSLFYYPVLRHLMQKWLLGCHLDFGAVNDNLLNL